MNLQERKVAKKIIKLAIDVNRISNDDLCLLVAMVLIKFDKYDKDSVDTYFKKCVDLSVELSNEPNLKAIIQGK